MDKIDKHRIFVKDKEKRSIKLDVNYKGVTIKIGTYSTDNGLKNEKIRNMMFNEIKKMLVGRINSVDSK